MGEILGGKHVNFCQTIFVFHPRTPFENVYFAFCLTVIGFRYLDASKF